MKHTLLILITLSSHFFVLSQEYSHEFKKPTSFELKLTECDFDKDSPALILYDIGETSIVENREERLEMQFKHRRKIKIFNQGGYDYAEIEIPYYVKGYRKESIKDIEAYSYNLENGKLIISKLDPKHIYEEVINDRFRVKKFAFPAVKDGTIIEYKYTLHSPYLTDYKDWDFQQDIPVKYSNYKALMNPFYSYAWMLQGTKQLDYYDEYIEKGLPRYYAGLEYKHKVYDFTMKNMKAFNDEAFITSRDDYIIKINFQLTEIKPINGSTISYLTTWPELVNELLKDSDLGKFKKAIERKTTDFIQANQLQKESPLATIEAISEFVKDNYEWDGYQYYIPYKSAREFLEKKTGNCASINLMLAGLLNNAGFEAHPVLISTRKNGKIKVDYPFRESFNYLAVIVNIDEQKQLLIDATERNLPFHVLPTRCINESGLIVKKGDSQWISLLKEFPSAVQYNLTLDLNEQLDSLVGNFTFISTGYDAYLHRNNLHDNELSQKNYLQKQNIFMSGEAKSIKYEKVKQPFGIAFEGASPVESAFGKIYITPFASLPYKENPLKQTERTYPIDFTYAKKRTFNSFITIPEGYSVDYLPKQKVINEKDFSLSYKAEVNGTQLTIIGSYEFKKAIYSPEEYKLLKYYFNKIIESFNDKIVLKILES